LLIQLYEEEESRLGVRYNNNIIFDIKRPLLPTKILVNELSGGIAGAATTV
jgi:hypothetical protein